MSEWTEWRSKPPIDDDAAVEIKLRDGTVEWMRAAKNVAWGNGNIVAYRLMPQPSEESENRRESNPSPPAMSG